MTVITEIDIFCSKSKRRKYVPLQSLLEVIKGRLDLYRSLEKLCLSEIGSKISICHMQSAFSHSSLKRSSHKEKFTLLSDLLLCFCLFRYMLMNTLYLAH